MKDFINKVHEKTNYCSDKKKSEIILKVKIIIFFNNSVP